MTTSNQVDLQLVRRRLERTGYCQLSGLPDDFDHVSQLARLGPLFSQYDGELVRDIMPDPDLGGDVIAANSTTELCPHTEWYEFSCLPPRYVALWCVHPNEGPGGETTLADGYHLLGRFSAAERARLFDTSYQWRTRPVLARPGADAVARHPILELRSIDLIVRFSTLDIVADDDLSRRYVRTGGAFFVETHVAVRPRRDTLLIWDNWRMLHARNAFADRRRHLRRVLVGG